MFSKKGSNTRDKSSIQFIMLTIWNYGNFEFKYNKLQIQSFLPYYSSFQKQYPKFWDFVKRACTKLMKILVAIQGRHPYSFGDKFVLSSVMDFCLNRITDPEPNLLSFEQFLIQCMVMIKNILECKEYKPCLTGRVVDEKGVTLEQMKKNISSAVGGVVTSLLPNDRIVLLCNVLVKRYFVLTASDLEEWYRSPESFHHEQDMVQWTEKLRPCAEALYIILFENNSQLLAPVVVSLLQETMNNCPTSVTKITSEFLLKDAAYGAAAYAYYELSNYLSFKDWFNGALSHESSKYQSKPCFKIIHTVCCSKLCISVQTLLQNHPYCMLLQTLHISPKTSQKFCTNNAKKLLSNLSKNSLNFHKNRKCKSCIKKEKSAYRILSKTHKFSLQKNSF